MPRLVPGGPGLAVSLDTLFIAYGRPGRVALYTATTRTERASAELPTAGDGAEEVDVVFLTSQRLLALVRRAEATQLLAFTVPALAPIAKLELPGALRPLAAVGPRLMLVNEAGEQSRIIHLTDRALAAEPIAVREPVQLAVAAPEERLLVAARDQLEAWDPIRRRALVRINLPLASPKFAGFCARWRLLWVAAATRLGEICAYRFSDGRITTRVELGRRILGADGHPESPRLVVAARADEQRPIELFQLDFSIDERFGVPLGSATPESFVMADGATPAVVIASGDGPPEFMALPRAVPLEELAPTPAPIPTSTAAARPRPPQLRPPSFQPSHPQPSRAPSAAAAASNEASWRERLGHPTGEHAPEGPSVQAQERAPTREGGAPGDDRAGSVEPMERLRGESWRGALAAWGAAAFASGQATLFPSLPEHDTPLAALIRRFGLDAQSKQAMALLYASWLLGNGAGVPLATLARALGDDAETAWSEALGLGALGQTGLVRPRGGRLQLRAVVGRFLDGQPPQVVVLTPAATQGSAAPTEGCHYLAADGNDPLDLGRELAEQLGRPVALVEVAARRRRERPPSGVIAARLHDAVPLILLDRDDPGAWLSLLGPELALVTGPGGERGLPRWSA